MAPAPHAKHLFPVSGLRKNFAANEKGGVASALLLFPYSFVCPTNFSLSLPYGVLVAAGDADALGEAATLGDGAADGFLIGVPP